MTLIKGSYHCDCEVGYKNVGETCEDVEECIEQSHLCHAHAICINTYGSYKCQCTEGYKGTGRECENVDECNDNNLNKCGNHAELRFQNVFLIQPYGWRRLLTRNMKPTKSVLIQ